MSRVGFWRRAARLSVGRLLGGRGSGPPDGEELEEILLEADFGVPATERLLAKLARFEGADPVAELRREIEAILTASGSTAIATASSGPSVYLMVGANGTGKTTSAAKLAHRLQRHGRTVLMAAADTFRAGAVEQLRMWAERSGAEFLKGREGGDPAAVAYDAVATSEARCIDAAVIDTAGRLHTNSALLRELAKIERVVEKRLGRPPDETLMALDATTGQNAVSQLAGFSRAVSVTGIVLTRVDSSAKGGIVVALAEEHKTPVKLVGTGERLDDLRPFDAKDFLDGIFVR